MDPDNLSGKDVLTAILPLVALAAGLGFYAKGMTVIALLILLPLFGYMIYAFVKMPWEEIGKKVYEKEQIQKQTLHGRIWLGLKRIFDYVSTIWFAIFILAITLSVYEKFFSNGS